MRVALLASTIALLASSPAFAQCVYVGCPGSAQSAPVYHQPAYTQQSVQIGGTSSTSLSYDEGFAAGLAARTHRQPGTRTSSARIHRKSTVTSARRHTSTSRTSAAPRAAASNRHVSAHTKRAKARPAAVRTVNTNRAMHTHNASRSHAHASTSGHSYHDPIKDRAATYRPTVYGQSTTMASLMSRSSSFSSSTTSWSGPATTVNQGGQVCGWGARIVITSHGQTERQAMWVCQCPQGWRPPGY
jgi:hypothetical protein